MRPSKRVQPTASLASRRVIVTVDWTSTVCPALRAAHPVDAAEGLRPQLMPVVIHRYILLLINKFLQIMVDRLIVLQIHER